MSASFPRARRVVVLLALLSVAALAYAGLSLAQDGRPPVKISAVTKVTPNKAGTKKHPQGINIDVRATIVTPLDYDPPLAESVDVWISRGGNYNGGRFTTCSKSTMDRRGVGACPKTSVMGTGTGKADADGVTSVPRITVVNGGAKKVYFYTVLTNPARVQKPVEANIKKLSSGKWGYKVHSVIPRSLQIVAGIPLRLQSLHVNAGAKRWAKQWIETTSCPSNHRWSYHVEVHYTTGETAKFDGSVGCRG